MSDLGVARMVVATIASAHGQPEVVPQLASGSGVHFGDISMFVPGTTPERLLSNVHRKMAELAFAYVAWEYAVEQAEREEMS